MKIRPVGIELFRADGQTDMKKQTVVFRNFSDAPKKRYLMLRPYAFTISQ